MTLVGKAFKGSRSSKKHDDADEAFGDVRSSQTLTERPSRHDNAELYGERLPDNLCCKYFCCEEQRPRRGDPRNCRCCPGCCDNVCCDKAWAPCCGGGGPGCEKFDKKKEKLKRNSKGSKGLKKSRSSKKSDYLDDLNGEDKDENDEIDERGCGNSCADCCTCRCTGGCCAR